MKAEDVCVFLTSYSLTVAFAALVDAQRQRRVSSLLLVVMALIALCGTTLVGFYLQPGMSYPRLLWRFVEQRDLSAAVSLAMGFAAALAWLAWPPFASADAERGAAAQKPETYAVRPWVLAFSIAGVVLGGQTFIWKSLWNVTRDPPSYVSDNRFGIEKIASLDYLPVRIATGDEGCVFVCYDYFEDWGDMGAAILRLSPQQTGKYDKRIVADSTLLMRSYGLAMYHGDLYVSRSGILPRASMGKIRFESGGAITQLRDLDQDGYFEYAHDVITGLPGARGPDTMQQNNGIVFAPDGSLFIASGCCANRDLDEHPWGGVVLRASPDFSRTEVFARGFRNPFGITLGPDHELFLTDNDVDENPGDELNHVVQGAHYGHPFVVPHEEHVQSEGFREPIFVGELESNLLGLAYATSPALPDEFRNCLYVTDYMQNTIWRMKLEADQGTYKVADVKKFATVSTPVDIAVSADGEFFVISRRHKGVYRIRLRQQTQGEGRE